MLTNGRHRLQEADRARAAVAMPSLPGETPDVMHANSSNAATVLYRFPQAEDASPSVASALEKLLSPHNVPPPAAPAASGSKLAAVILLAGTVRESSLSLAACRPVLELPIRDDYRIIDQWTEHVGALRSGLAVPALPIRLLLHPHAAPAQAGAAMSHGSRKPTRFQADLVAGEAPAPRAFDGQASRAATEIENAVAIAGPDLHMTAEIDRAAFRGTGGTLRDLAAHYDDDCLLLVVNSQQVLLRSLPEMVAMLLDSSESRDADVRLLTEPDESPSGVMMVRAGCLRDIPATGYIDFKEQGLPLIARRHVVVALRSGGPTGNPVRCAKTYLDALRAYHLSARGLQVPPGPFEERWESSFAVREAGSIVDEGTELYDTVILSGAQVQAGARVVRSVICPGGIVRRGQRCQNMLIRPGARPRESAVAVSGTRNIASLIAASSARSRESAAAEVIAAPIDQDDVDGHLRVLAGGGGAMPAA